MSRSSRCIDEETQLLTQHLEDCLSSFKIRMLRYIHDITLEEHRTNEGIQSLALMILMRMLQWYGHEERE